MHCGWDPHPLLKEADVVLVVDRVPWIPKEGKPKARPRSSTSARTRSSLYRCAASAPTRAHGRVAPTLQALWRAAQKQAVSLKRIEERRRFARSDDIRTERKSGVDPMPASITGKWLSACVNKVLDDNTSSSTSTRPCSRKW